MKLILKGVPSERQGLFFNARGRHIAYGGARGGGKSWAMRRKLVLLCLSHEGLNCLLMRRTLPELRENHLNPLLEELSSVCKYNATERVFKFPSGSRIKLGYCDSPTDIYQYQGQEYDVIGMEEATHFTREQMRFMATCNRTTKADFTPRMYYTCNPGNVGHDWVKRLFIDRRYENGENPEDYCFIPARIYDNRVLMQRDPGYIRQLEALPEELKRAHLYGDWDAFVGQFFKEFSRERHVVSAFEIPKWWKRFISMDWGYNDPCCVLWNAVDGDGCVYTYRELYVRHKRPDEVASAVLRLSGGESIAYAVASPDMWQKRGGILRTEGGIEGETIAELFSASGVPLTPADNSRVAGWQRVRSFLGNGDQGRPMWRAFECCENLIRTLPMLRFDSHNREDAADGEDHAPEALRYALMSRPGKSLMPKVREAPRYDPFAVREGRKGGFFGL